MNIEEAINSMRSSQVERASVRPWWFGQEKVMDSGVFWRRTSLGLGWSLQKHVWHSKIIRLVHNKTRRLAGWGLDEDFLRDELWPLQVSQDGQVKLQDLALQSSLRIAHLSDLHMCWRRHETLEGRSMDVDVLHKLVRSLQQEKPDLIVITGDLTDNGLGYMRIYQALQPWISGGRLLLVPGNHDLNRLGLTQMASAYKHADWQNFSRLVMGPNKAQRFALCAGPWLMAGLDSSGSEENKSIADNALGHVRQADLNWLAQRCEQTDAQKTRVRMLMLHHHLEVPPANRIEQGHVDHNLLKAMQLGNANRVLDFCRKYRFGIVLHGHKHVSYLSPSSRVDDLQIVSAPSTTLERSYHILKVYNKGKLQRNKVLF